MGIFVDSFTVIFLDLCDLPSETGRCRAYIPSWYYDSGEERCKTFIYGGCGGNANRFATKEACEQRCGKGILKPYVLNCVIFTFLLQSHKMKKGTSRQRSGKGAIRKRFPLQKPRWEKTKLTIRHLYHETYRKPNEQLFSQ